MKATLYSKLKYKILKQACFLTLCIILLFLFLTKGFISLFEDSNCNVFVSNDINENIFIFLLKSI